VLVDARFKNFAADFTTGPALRYRGLRCGSHYRNYLLTRAGCERVSATISIRAVRCRQQFDSPRVSLTMLHVAAFTRS
jgi:hypothetical protein